MDEKGQGVDICDNYDYDDDDDDDGDDIMEEKLKLLKSPSKESATEEVSYTDQNSSFSSKRKTFVDDFDNCAASYHTTYSATYPNATVLFVDIYGKFVDALVIMPNFESRTYFSMVLHFDARHQDLQLGVLYGSPRLSLLCFRRYTEGSMKLPSDLAFSRLNH